MRHHSQHPAAVLLRKLREQDLSKAGKLRTSCWIAKWQPTYEGHASVEIVTASLSREQRVEAALALASEHQPILRTDVGTKTCFHLRLPSAIPSEPPPGTRVEYDDAGCMRFIYEPVTRRELQGDCA